jgi:hypothetical protein
MDSTTVILQVCGLIVAYLALELMSQRNRRFVWAYLILTGTSITVWGTELALFCQAEYGFDNGIWLLMGAAANIPLIFWGSGRVVDATLLARKDRGPRLELVVRKK